MNGNIWEICDRVIPEVSQFKILLIVLITINSKLLLWQRYAKYQPRSCMYRVCTSAENVIYILFRVTAYLVLEHSFAVYRCEEFPMDSFAPNLSLVGFCGSAGRNYREYFFFFFPVTSIQSSFTSRHQYSPTVPWLSLIYA